jgi:diguanylate cyclase (GGDEF)-like protein
MTGGGTGRAKTASLRTRVLLLTLLIFAAVSAPAYLAFNWMVDQAIVKLGTLFAEKQILFDRYRGMETLSRESSLAATLARSPIIADWAKDENDPAKRARGIAELEHYREAFADKSYFFVVDASGNYYFNDRDNAYKGKELSYTLDPGNPRDGWYYKTIAASHDCQLNVDHDDTIRVTKVWINCPVVERGKVLGIIGTGIDLTNFIREVVDIPQTGVVSVFVDHSGAIQAHRDPKMVDFHSLTKDAKAKKTIFALVERQTDRDAIASMMKAASNGANSVEAQFVRIGGRKVLAGVGYLNNLGWFNVSLMDVDKIIERSLFTPIAALLGVMLIAAALLVTLLFKRIVLDRLARLETAVRGVEAGNYAIADVDRSKDEIGHLSRTFASMAATVGDNAQVLEAIVRERTAKLERLAEIDPLTEVYNRRGFIRAVERERNRAGRHKSALGLLLVDLDLLKTVNDNLGHQAGDHVLAEVARRLRSALRSYDICARWGGDEFAVLVSECDAAALAGIADKIRTAIGGTPIGIKGEDEVTMTVSIGACLVRPDESIDSIAAKADTALYAAKGAGRDTVVLHGGSPDHEAPSIDLR